MATAIRRWDVMVGEFIPKGQQQAVLLAPRRVNLMR